jgi:hypothetical protein
MPASYQSQIATGLKELKRFEQPLELRCGACQKVGE